MAFVYTVFFPLEKHTSISEDELNNDRGAFVQHSVGEVVVDKFALNGVI